MLEMLSHLKNKFLTVTLSHLYLDYLLIGASTNEKKDLCKLVEMHEFEMTSPPEFAEPRVFLQHVLHASRSNHQLTVQVARICLTNFCFKKGQRRCVLAKGLTSGITIVAKKKYPASMYTKEGRLACCR